MGIYKYKREGIVLDIYSESSSRSLVLSCRGVWIAVLLPGINNLKVFGFPINSGEYYSTQFSFERLFSICKLKLQGIAQILLKYC